jgi:small subunit ribosomal protein S20
MPHSISAAKRVRQNARHRDRNRAIKSRIRSARRAFLKAVEAKDLAAARERLVECQQLLHRAANNGPIHRNLAGRVIGRMQCRLDALTKAAPATT